MNEKPFDMGAVRARLLLDHPFWGTAAYHVEPVEDRTIKTLWTNGTALHYNPDYLASLTLRQRECVLAHEVSHCVLLHPWRRNGRDLKEWNIACDHQINLELQDAGFDLPQGAVIDPQFRGMSAEQIYSKRRSNSQPPQQQPEQEPKQEPDDGDDSAGDGDDDEADGTGDDDEGEGSDKDDDDDSAGDGDGPGELVMPDSPTGEFGDGAETSGPDGDQKTADEWETIAAEAAFVAERAGFLPSGAKQAIEQSREPRVDWVAETRDFLTNSQPTGRTWKLPNRRFVHQGLYLPGRKKENVGTLVLAVDTSGSTIHLREQFAGELQGLLQLARPEKLIVVYCDSAVQKTVEYSPDDPEATIEMVGGGGTAFSPVFDWVDQENLDPLALVYLTDLEAYDAPEEPSYPVLWVAPAHVSRGEPFGRLVTIP